MTTPRKTSQPKAANRLDRNPLLPAVNVEELQRRTRELESKVEKTEQTVEAFQPTYTGGGQGMPGADGQDGQDGKDGFLSLVEPWDPSKVYQQGDVVLYHNGEVITTGNNGEYGAYAKSALYQCIYNDNTAQPNPKDTTGYGLSSPYVPGTGWQQLASNEAYLLSRLFLALQTNVGGVANNLGVAIEEYFPFNAISWPTVNNTFGSTTAASVYQALSRIVSALNYNFVLNQIPPTPANVQAVFDGSAVTVSWNGDVSASGYRVYEDGLLQRQTDEYYVTFVPGDPNESHAYSVEAFNSKGTSARSGDVYTNALTPAAPGQPTVTAIGGGRVNVSWPTVPGAETYRVYRNSMLHRQFSALESSSMSFLDVVSSTGTYSYRVSASSTGGESSQSPAASVTVTSNLL